MVTKPPVLSLSFNVFTPLAPRDVSLYSSIGVSLAIPLLETVKTIFPSFDVARPITLPPSRLTPLTPVAVRPIERTSLSSNIQIFPLDVPIKIFADPSVALTLNNSSPSRTLSAIFPALLMYSYSSTEVFLIIPFSVTNTRYF